MKFTKIVLTINIILSIVFHVSSAELLDHNNTKTTTKPLLPSEATTQTPAAVTTSSSFSSFRESEDSSATYLDNNDSESNSTNDETADLTSDGANESIDSTTSTTIDDDSEDFVPSAESPESESPGSNKDSTNVINPEQDDQVNSPTEDYSDSEDEDNLYHVGHINQTVELLSRWAKITENAIQMVVSEAMPHATEFGYRFDISEECILSLLQLVNGFRKQKAWAFRLIDSYGRPSPGSLDGTVTSLGDYDECLGIEFPKYFGEEVPITGKYCTIRIDFPVPDKPERVEFHQPSVELNGTHLNETVWGYLTKYLRTAYTMRGFRFGVCIPSTCSADELEPVIRKAASPILQMPLTFGPDDECSYRAEVIPLNFYSKISLTFFAAIISVVVLSTVLDLFGLITRQTNQSSIMTFGKMFASCFSFNQANQYLNRPSGKSTPNILSGLAVLTMYCLIIGHTYFFGGFYKTSESINRWTEDLPSNLGKLTNQVFLNTHLFLDSLFFISGVSIACLYLPKVSSTRWISDYLLLVLSRWLRFVPLISGVILINYLFPYLSSGPNYKYHVYQIIDNCQVNWWSHFLAIGNLYGNVDTMCAPHLWYLSVDIQLHLFCIIIFMGYHRSINTGLILNLIFIFIGVLSSAISNLYYDTNATFGLDHIVDYDSLQRQFDVTYFPTYLHLAPFAFGIMIGTLVHKYTNKTKPIKFSMLISVNGWLFCAFLSIVAMFSSFLWNNVDIHFNLNLSSRVIFAGFQRTLWCSFLAWAIFLCTTGESNFFTSALSSHHFRVLSRLVGCIYAVHTIPIDIRTYSFKFTKLWDDHFFISWSLFNIVSAITLGDRPNSF
uniref:Nose resistant-to-fluoxetine protein N-terminal domain-containing protein n=1 Tax=Tetranychus urticae TaxID=32264 RepID=T1KDH0_TETUR